MEPGPLVDVHSHFLTPQYVAAARAAGHEHPDGMPGWPEWDVMHQLDLMDELGISTALLSISSPGVHFGDDAAARALSRHVNDAGADIRRANSTRFGQLASLPLPDVVAALTELEHALDQLGCDGVIVETNAGGSYLGDDRYRPLLAELNRRRTPTLVHPTSPPGAEALALGRPRPLLEFIFDTARTVADLALAGRFEEFPDIPWVIPHAGGALPLLVDRMELFRLALSGPGAPGAPLPEQLRRLWFDMAGTPFPRQLPVLASWVGTDRLLYGSDSCWTPAAAVAAQAAAIEAAPQPAGDTWRALTTRNAVRLFPRLDPAR